MWLWCSCLNALDCSFASIINIVPFKATPSIIASSSFNVLYSHMSLFCFAWWPAFYAICFEVWVLVFINVNICLRPEEAMFEKSESLSSTYNYFCFEKEFDLTFNTNRIRNIHLLVGVCCTAFLFGCLAMHDVIPVITFIVFIFSHMLVIFINKFVLCVNLSWEPVC